MRNLYCIKDHCSKCIQSKVHLVPRDHQNAIYWGGGDLICMLSLDNLIPGVFIVRSNSTVGVDIEQGRIHYGQNFLSFTNEGLVSKVPSFVTANLPTPSLPYIFSPSSTMDSDEQPFSILPYSRHSTNQNRMNIHLDHLLHPAPRQYTSAPEFQDNYGNEPQPSMLQNTPRYRALSRTIKEEDLNTYIYSSPTDFRGEMNLNVHSHPTHPDHSTIRYPASHNPYSSDSNTIRMASSRLGTPDARLASGPPETGSADFRYQIHALQPQQHLLHSQRHQHGPLPHHQHQNHTLNHLQGGSAFYSPSINYSSQDQEHSSPSMGGLDLPQTRLASLEYDSREPHAQHVPVPGMVYDSLAVPGHPQQGVRRDTTMNHHSSLASISNGNSGSGSYHTASSPVSSIPMSNNHSTTSSMNTSVLGAHISSSFSIGPSSSSRWAGHSSSYDMSCSSASHSQVPALSSTPASTSASSSLRPILRHTESDSRSTPENSFTQNNFHLRPSTSAQTLSSSHSHTKSPSPRLSDNESIPNGRHLGSEMFIPDDRESDYAAETIIRMSGRGSAKRKGVTKTGEKGKETSTPGKKKKKSKMHCCEVCMKKFPRPSGLRTHMNTHSNEKPYPCGFPGCTRSFGVRSNAKRHLRTHGVIPKPATNANSINAPYIVGFCPPMIGVPQSSSHRPSQISRLHSIEGGEAFSLPSSRLPGDNANIHTQDQGQSDMQLEMSSVPTVKLRWMPPSLTTRTNAGSLREVVDEQQMHWMGDVVKKEDGDDDFVAGGSGIRHVRRTSGGGYDRDMEQDDRVEDGDKVEFGENVPRLGIPPSSCPAIASSSTSAVAASSSMGIRLTLSRPAERMYSPPRSESPTQGTYRPSSSSSRIISSISPSSTSFATRSNSSLSPASMSGYGQHDIDITNVGGGDVYTTRTENISREYGI